MQRTFNFLMGNGLHVGNAVHRPDVDAALAPIRKAMREHAEKLVSPNSRAGNQLEAANAAVAVAEARIAEVAAKIRRLETEGDAAALVHARRELTAANTAAEDARELRSAAASIAATQHHRAESETEAANAASLFAIKEILDTAEADAIAALNKAISLPLARLAAVFEARHRMIFPTSIMTFVREQ